MSKLAAKLEEVQLIERPLHGQKGACYGLYSSCDEEDYQAITRMKEDGATWKQVQAAVDDYLGIDNPLTWRVFSYHWRRQCRCWPKEGQR